MPAFASDLSSYRVVKVKNSLGLINVGSELGLVKGQKLIVKRRGRGKYIDLGMAVVIKAEKRQSAVMLTDGVDFVSLKKGDLLFNSERDYQTFRSRSRSPGFNGVKWGTDIRMLNDLEFLFDTGVNYLGMEFYDKLIDIDRIENVDIENIEYSFSGDKFTGVIINTRGEDNFNGLKKACFKKFGRCSHIDKMGKTFYWKYKKSIVILRYSFTSREGMLYITSRELLDQLRFTDVALNHQDDIN